jgi:hypothetical protein
MHIGGVDGAENENFEPFERISVGVDDDDDDDGDDDTWSMDDLLLLRNRDRFIASFSDCCFSLKF